MDTIWTIVNSQEPKVKEYFENLYLKCIIEDKNLYSCEEFVLWNDLKLIKSCLSNKSTLKGHRINSTIILENPLFTEYFNKELFEEEDKIYIEAHFLNNYNHLSKALAIFDSYLKRISNEKGKHRSDNIIKIVIAVITAFSTLIAVWTGYSLKSDENGEENRKKSNYNTKDIIILNKTEKDSLFELYKYIDSIK